MVWASLLLFTTHGGCIVIWRMGYTIGLLTPSQWTRAVLPWTLFFVFISSLLFLFPHQGFLSLSVITELKYFWGIRSSRWYKSWYRQGDCLEMGRAIPIVLASSFVWCLTIPCNCCIADLYTKMFNAIWSPTFIEWRMSYSLKIMEC